MERGPTQASDEELVSRIQDGDERALGELYDRYSERLFSLACTIVGDPADAEEAVADAFLRLWRKREHDPDRGSVGAYLVMVTRSRALDRRRASARRGHREESGAEAHPDGMAVPVSSPGDPPDEAAERSEARGRIAAALEALSQKQRDVIRMAYFGGLSHSEIAEELAEPLGTIKTRLRDGMKRLRLAFDGQGRGG